MHFQNGYKGLFPRSPPGQLAASGRGRLPTRRLVRESGRLHSACGRPDYRKPPRKPRTASVSRLDKRRDDLLWPAPHLIKLIRRERYFGAMYACYSVDCEREPPGPPRSDAPFPGAFDHRTAAASLVIGDFGDPATNLDNAVRVARRMPNSRA